MSGQGKKQEAETKTTRDIALKVVQTVYDVHENQAGWTLDDNANLNEKWVRKEDFQKLKEPFGKAFTENDLREIATKMVTNLEKQHFLKEQKIIGLGKPYPLRVWSKHGEFLAGYYRSAWIEHFVKALQPLLVQVLKRESQLKGKVEAIRKLLDKFPVMHPIPTYNGLQSEHSYCNIKNLTDWFAQLRSLLDVSSQEKSEVFGEHSLECVSQEKETKP